jgi:hypothetical protein
MTNRDAIYSALFALIVGDPALAGKFVSTGRFLRFFEDVAPEQCPALYMVQEGESWVRKGKGIPPIRTLRCKLVMYAYSGDPLTGTLPATLANAMLDVVDVALNSPPSPDNAVTLGGLVDHVYMEGEVRIFEGLLQEKTIVTVPIAMLLP